MNYNLVNNPMLASLMMSLEGNKGLDFISEIYETMDEEDELDLYLKEPTLNAGKSFNVLEYWYSRNDSPLKRMALDILSIPASSVDVERIFSSSKRDDSHLRQNMDPVFKGELQVAKSWYLLEHKLKHN